MDKVNMKALRQTTGSYGNALPGDEFETDEDTAKVLEKMGSAKRTGKQRSTEKETDESTEKAATKAETEPKAEAVSTESVKAKPAHFNKALKPAQNKRK